MRLVYVTTFCLLFFVVSCCPGRSSQTAPTPDTWSKETIYFLLVDRFHNQNKDNDLNVNLKDPLAYHGGDLQGLTSKLEYLDQLGVGTLLFTPIMDNRNTDFFGHWGLHGYWIIDHYKIDEHFGTKKNLEVFTKARIKYKKRLLLDVVLNHVDWDHPWKKKHPKWFHKLGDIKNWDDPKQLVEGNVTGLPDLDQRHPDVYRELMKYSQYWINLTKPDGFRLDAVKHIDHHFWKRYINDIQSFVKSEHNKSDFLFLGEILHGDPNYYRPYIEDGFNAFYDYPMYYTMADVFARSKSLFHLPARLQVEDRIFGNTILLTTFLDNHDMPRFLSLSDTVSVTDLHQALAFIMTIRGLPMITYGTEEYMTGKTGELGRKSMQFAKPPPPIFKTLMTLRQASPSLASGIREDLLVDNSTYIFGKAAPQEESLVILTRNAQPLNLDLPLEQNSLFWGKQLVSDTLTQRQFQIKDGTLHLRNLKPKDIVILTAKGRSARYTHLQKLKPEKINITVSLNMNDLKTNEKLFIVGAQEIIGGWNPNNALGPLHKTETNQWIISLNASKHQVLEYKFIKKDTSGKVTWENTPNRFFFVTDLSKTITNTWNQIDAE